MQNAAPPQKPNSQMGRDALLVHGLALLSAIMAGTTAAFLGPGNESAPAVLGVGFGAIVTLCVWSLVLAIRALRKGERVRWPAIVLVLGVLEISAVSVLFWEAGGGSSGGFVRWAVGMGLPVFVPVFLLASLIAVPVTWWRVRRAEARDTAPAATGETPVVPRTSRSWPAPAAPSRRRRWKRALAWYCAVMALAVAVLLPCPLFLFCAYHRSGWYARDGERDWRDGVVQHTPAFIGDTAARIASLSSWSMARDIYLRALLTGKVSTARLERELLSTDANAQYCAFEGLLAADSQAVLARAERIGNGQTTGLAVHVIFEAGRVLAERGTAAQIRPFLDATRSPPAPSDFMNGLLYGLRHGARADLLPDVQRFCEPDSAARADALGVLASLCKPQDIEPLWAKLLGDSDPARRDQAFAAISGIRDAKTRLKVVAAGLESSDAGLRLAFLQNTQVFYCIINDCREGGRSLRPRVVRALLPMLELGDEDMPSRRLALWCLAEITGAPEPMQRGSYLLSHNFAALSKGVLRGITEGILLKSVAEHARKGLEKTR